MILTKEESVQVNCGFICDLCDKEYKAGFHPIVWKYYDDCGDEGGSRAELCEICILDAIDALKSIGVKFRSIYV